MTDYIVYLVKRDEKRIVCQEEVIGNWNLSRDVDLRSAAGQYNFLGALNNIIDADPPTLVPDPIAGLPRREFVEVVPGDWVTPEVARGRIELAENQCPNCRYPKGSNGCARECGRVTTPGEKQ